jgi:hypothetical protein
MKLATANTTSTLYFHLIRFTLRTRNAKREFVRYDVNVAVILIIILICDADLFGK